MELCSRIRDSGTLRHAMEITDVNDDEEVAGMSRPDYRGVQEHRTMIAYLFSVTHHANKILFSRRH